MITLTHEHVNDAIERVLTAALRMLSAERALGSSNLFTVIQDEDEGVVGGEHVRVE